MPNTAATALWPTAAAQMVAMSRPRAVAATMMARGAPRTPNGTTPTKLRPSATEPAMKLPRPKMDGSPAMGPTTAGAAGASSAAAAGRPDSPAVASTVVIASLLEGERPAFAGLPASVRPQPDTCVLTLNQGPRGSAPGGDDPVLVDLAVDRGARHAQRFGGPDLVAVVILQALHDRVPLDGLQRGQQPAAHRPALRRQVLGHDRPGPAALDDLLEHLPELLGVARPGVPQQQLHGLGRAGQPTLLAEPGQEERHQLVQVLDVMAQRRQLHRALEEPQQPGQVGGRVLAVQRDGYPQVFGALFALASFALAVLLLALLAL